MTQPTDDSSSSASDYDYEDGLLQFEERPISNDIDTNYDKIGLLDDGSTTVESPSKSFNSFESDFWSGVSKTEFALEDETFEPIVIIPEPSPNENTNVQSNKEFSPDLSVQKLQPSQNFISLKATQLPQGSPCIIRAMTEEVFSLYSFSPEEIANLENNTILSDANYPYHNDTKNLANYKKSRTSFSRSI